MLILLYACTVAGSIELGGGDTGRDPAGVDSGDTAERIEGDTSEDTGKGGDTPDEPEPTVVVDCNGGADYSTITEAIAASHSGDRIGLRACTYRENLNYLGKSLDIYGLDSRERVIIEAADRAPVVTAQRGESIGTRLAHVTLTGGAGGYGSALYVDRALFTLEDAVVRDNGSASSTFYQSGASVRLIDVVAFDNETSSRQGIEMFANDGSMHLQRFELTCGRAAYGIYHHVGLLMTDSTINCPEASYGVVVDGGEVHVRRSRIEGGSVGLYAEDNDDTRNERVWLFNTIVVADDNAVTTNWMHVKVRNSVLWGGTRGISFGHPHVESYLYSSAFLGSRCGVDDDGSPYVASWNAIGESSDCGFAGTDTVAGDPMFVDAPNDFHLAEGSPLIDAGDPDPGENDDDDTRNDIGAYGGPEADGPR
jgi:hypothetical protein